MSQFKFLSFVTIRVLSFVTIEVFSFFLYDLSFRILSQFFFSSPQHLDNRPTLRAAFRNSCDVFLRGCVILCVEMLHDFCVWRGCVIFLTQSLRLHDLFFWRLPDLFFAGRLGDFFWVIFLWRACMIFLWRGCIIFFCGEVLWFHLLRGCVILCVERLCDLSHSLTQVAWFIFLEVVWFFCGQVAWFLAALSSSRTTVVLLRDGMIFCVWRGCMIFVCEAVAWLLVWKKYF